MNKERKYIDVDTPDQAEAAAPAPAEPVAPLRAPAAASPSPAPPPAAGPQDGTNTVGEAAPGQRGDSEAYTQLLDSIKRRMDPTSNTVIIVDDERAIRRRVARDIQKNDQNIVILEAGNGQEALDKLEEVRQTYRRDPLLMVVDLNMPVMDGWTLIATLKKDYEGRGETQGIPIIVLSSTAGEKGFVFKKSVHHGKTGYAPLVSIAKETCIDPTKYDASGEKGLMAWLKYFMGRGSAY
jgi:CheY-like chemotaxis protein